MTALERAQLARQPNSLRAGLPTPPTYFLPASPPDILRSLRFGLVWRGSPDPADLAPFFRGFTMGILRQLFGPSKEEIWQKLASELAARYESEFWTGTKVEAEYGEWTITLDSHVVSTGKTTHHYTRLRAPYVNPDGFRFSIYRRHLFTDLAKWLGMQDLTVGHAAFDEAFVIQGNNEEKVRELFADESIRQLLAGQPDVSFMVREDQGWFSRIHPEGVDELYFQAHGIIKDVDRLKELFALFGLVLDRLCEIGSAYETSPKKFPPAGKDQMDDKTNGQG